jgi:cell division septal protein FtsQ
MSWLRRTNRRITVENRSPLVALADLVVAGARRAKGLGKVLAAVAALGAGLYAVRAMIGQLAASPRFSVREVRVGPTLQVGRDELVELASVALGDRLLAVDTDAVAARVARHPWIAAAKVQRQLPATLVIDVTERRAAAVAVLSGGGAAPGGGGLYLVDETGRPFKRATLDEAAAEGLVVLTGISRAQYLALPQASEAAFREALALVHLYQHPGDGAAVRVRPPLSEVHVDPPSGFSAFLLEGGGEIRFGRGAIPEKLARLDQILAALGWGLGRGRSKEGPRAAAIRAVHLDGPAAGRVPVRLE